jgi:endonuclease/exonuclease/phosphatase family metal-dependent hydrolase
MPARSPVAKAILVALFFSFINFFQVPPVAHASTDIVLYAKDATISGSSWNLNTDTTAAGSASLLNPNLDQAKVATPLVVPASFAQMTFAADANTPYHLWLRMKAANDDYNNDSVYVQFSDSLDNLNGANYRIGTASALNMILEEGSGANVSGWGWNDNSYGTLGSNIGFATTGTHTIKFQQREDGVMIDQIVLSPAAYLNLSPGALKNDTKILPATQGPSSILPSPTPPPLPPGVTPAPAGTTFKVANWNIRSGDGSCASGFSCPFNDTVQNCTDQTMPMNAWGKGFVQGSLNNLNTDQSIIALGLEEAWNCGKPANVNSVLGWKFASGEYDGAAMLARYGIVGSLQTKQVSWEGELRFVLGADVCVNAACSGTVRVYVSHLGATAGDVDTATQMYNLISWVNSQPQANQNVIVGDFNVYDLEQALDFTCEATSNSVTLPVLRTDGYFDAWVTNHGTAPGMTATLNHNGCGSPNNSAWKRIDYAWTKNLTATATNMFGLVPVNNAAPSDHYGIIAQLTVPTTLVPQVPLPPPPTGISPPPPPPPAPPTGTCTFSLDTTSIFVGTSQDDRIINVTASSPTCPWTYASDASWLVVKSVSPLVPIGSGYVKIRVIANATGAIRTGHFTVAGITYTVTQDK